MMMHIQIKVKSMEKYSMKIFKILLILIAAFILTLSIIGLIMIIRVPVNPTYRYILYPILIAIYLSSILIYLSFYQTWIFLTYIEKDQIFMTSSISCMHQIKIYGLIFSAIYIIALPFFYLLANADDAPGVIFVGMTPLVLGILVYLFADIFKKIIQKGMHIQSINS